jgi:hypothetical protein
METVTLLRTDKKICTVLTSGRVATEAMIPSVITLPQSVYQQLNLTRLDLHAYRDRFRSEAGFARPCWVTG